MLMLLLLFANWKRIVGLPEEEKLLSGIYEELEMRGLPTSANGCGFIFDGIITRREITVTRPL